ncbi:hypothetical protein OC846_003827 [Tilletia horrida]|uniref:Manganese/iron superoxide dismutase C-terminal domain-containing protein n=1 Tax=Tilletia horrida TaxID=155126 RepID=A0AAN6GND6_9BASI|nr:hypothetical protein OC846_003827 [Tilletia horrida]KAK0565088.1 hypothetical protein OC861_003948 [Tilletia horrida]
MASRRAALSSATALSSSSPASSRIAFSTARLPSSRSSSAPRQSRSLHSCPPLPAKILEAQGECAPFLSSKAIQLIGVEWQSGLLSRLNDEVRGTEFEMATVPETVLGTARDRSKILACNLASQALNNRFFLNGLAPKKNLDAPSKSLPTERVSRYTGQRTFLQALDASPYRNLTTLQSAFSAAAMGMSSSGWLWLVRDQHGKLGIVPTYGAGTLLIDNGEYRATGGAVASSASQDEGVQASTNGSGSEGASASPVPPAAGQTSSPTAQDNVGATVGGGVSGPTSAQSPSSPMAASEPSVPPAAGQTSSSTAQDNVGATVGGGVSGPASSQSPSGQDQSAVREEVPQGQQTDGSTDRLAPSAPGATSPASTGNQGGAIGGGIGVSSGRSFSTSAYQGAPAGDGSDVAGALNSMLGISRRSAGQQQQSSSSTSSGTTNSHMGAYKDGPRYTPGVTSASILATAGYQAASPLGRDFRRSVVRRALDEYESDAGYELCPLLCLSVHEHAWMTDYGLWGKEEYLRQFWECVDWVLVQHLYRAYE